LVACSSRVRRTTDGLLSSMSHAQLAALRHAIASCLAAVSLITIVTIGESSRLTGALLWGEGSGI
jgi:hypothetical protein